MKSCFVRGRKKVLALHSSKPPVWIAKQRLICRVDRPEYPFAQPKMPINIPYTAAWKMVTKVVLLATCTEDCFVRMYAATTAAFSNTLWGLQRTRFADYILINATTNGHVTAKSTSSSSQQPMTWPFLILVPVVVQGGQTMYRVSQHFTIRKTYSNVFHEHNTHTSDLLWNGTSRASKRDLSSGDSG